METGSIFSIKLGKIMGQEKADALQHSAFSPEFSSPIVQASNDL